MNQRSRPEAKRSANEDKLHAVSAIHADRLVARNLVIGGIMYVLVALMVRLVVPSDEDPLLAGLLNLYLLAAVVSLGLRIWCRFTFENNYRRRPRLWQWCSAASALVIALSWGPLSGYVVWLVPGGFEAMTFALISAGVAVGITAVFSHRLPIAITCLLLLLMPLLYGLLRDGVYHSQYAASTFAIFGIYLIMLTYNRYREVWDRILKSQELQARNEDLMRLTRELAVSNRKAEAASSAKSQFIANTSHELRTPLHSILGNAELLQSSELADKQRRQVSAISRSGRSLLNLVNDLIDLSRIEAGQLKVAIEAVELRSLVSDVDSEMRLAATEKDLTLECLVEEDAPEWLALDGTRLQQIIINLVGNAIKYTQTGRVRLFVSFDRESNALEVYVTDTGPGLPPDKREQVFGEFVQLENSATRSHQGAGLGLAISKRLVKAMRGKIGVDSSVGGGSTFWFSLPATVVDAPHRRLGSGQVNIPEPLTSARVLVVDDNDSNRQMVVEQIRMLGFHCQSVRNGQAAIDELAGHGASYDLVLMDCQMPEMDGYEAVRRIRLLDEPASHVPVVALTANAMTEERAKCLHAGMDDYVAKPVSLAGLKRVINRWSGGLSVDGPKTAQTAPSTEPVGPCSKTVQPSEPPQDQAIDEQRLDELLMLRDHLGAENLQSTFETFQSDVLARLEELTQHARSVDCEAASRCCHAIKGMLLDFGLRKLSGQIAGLEQQARDGHITVDLIRNHARLEDFQKSFTRLAERLDLRQSSAGV